MTSMAYFSTSSSSSENIPLLSSAPVAGWTRQMVEEYGSSLPQIDRLAIALLRLADEQYGEIREKQQLAAKLLCHVANKVLQSDFDEILLSEAIQQMALCLMQGALALYHDRYEGLAFRVLTSRASINASLPESKELFLASKTTELLDHFARDIFSYNLASLLLSVTTTTQALTHLSSEELQEIRLKLAMRVLDVAFLERTKSASVMRIYSVLIQLLPSILQFYVAAEKKTFALH